MLAHGHLTTVSEVSLLLGGIALATQAIPLIHISLLRGLSVCRLLSVDYSCTLFKPFDGYRCHLADILMGSYGNNDTSCSIAKKRDVAFTAYKTRKKAIPAIANLAWFLFAIRKHNVYLPGDFYCDCFIDLCDWDHHRDYCLLASQSDSDSDSQTVNERTEHPLIGQQTWPAVQAGFTDQVICCSRLVDYRSKCSTPRPTPSLRIGQWMICSESIVYSPWPDIPALWRSRWAGCRDPAPDAHLQQ